MGNPSNVAFFLLDHNLKLLLINKVIRSYQCDAVFFFLKKRRVLIMFLHAARQPIFDCEQNLYAYNLHFRNDNGDFFSENAGGNATSKLVAASQFKSLLPELTNGNLAHVNFNVESLLRGYPSKLPADQAVVALVGHVYPKRSLGEACEKLYEAGFKLLIDDYQHTTSWLPIIPYLAIVQVDANSVSINEIRCLQRLKAQHGNLRIAVKSVSTVEVFESFKSLGFDYFQGRFFTQGQLLESKLHLLTHSGITKELLECLAQPNKLPVTISNFQSTSSVLDQFECSLVLMGKIEEKQVFEVEAACSNIERGELLKLVAFFLVAQSNRGNSSELLAMSLVRAKFNEELALVCKSAINQIDAFLAGIFSLLDVMLHSSFDAIVKQLPLSCAIKEALVSKTGKLAQITLISQCFETADWAQLKNILKSSQIELIDINRCYRKAVIWSNRHMRVVS